MIDMLKMFARSAGAAGAGLALMGAAALPLQAAAQDEATTSAAQARAPVESSASQVVVKDAATGALRAATPAEANALAQSKGSVAEFRRAKALPMSKVHRDGARGARLTDEFMSYAVLVRQPDGSMAAVCFDSREEADAAVSAPLSAVKATIAPTE